jgi:hypothetical protein
MDEEMTNASGHVLERITKTGEFRRVISLVIEADHLSDDEQMRAAVELVIDGIGVRIE